MSITGILVTTLFAGPAPATTAAGTQILVKLDAGKKLVCETKSVEGVKDASVVLDADFPGKGVSVRVLGMNEEILLIPGESIPIPRLAGETTADVKVTYKKQTCERKEVPLPTPVGAQEEETAGEKGEKDTDDPFVPLLAELVQEARVWLRNAGHTGHTVVQRGAFRTLTIYHTPDGRPAFPLPADIEETDTIVLAVVVPEKGAARIASRTCPKLKLGRVRGSIEESIEALGFFKSKPAGKVRTAVAWNLVEVGEFRCSEKLEYQLVTHLPLEYTSEEGVTTEIVSAKYVQSITLDPVYFVSVGVALAFDVGRPDAVGLRERPSATMMGMSDKYVASSRDYSGLKPLITVGLHPCGANPNKWRPCDMFSPTMVFDPTRFLKGAGVGMNFTFTPWFGVLVALNFYKSRVLDPGSKIKDGDTWTTTGDLPTHEVFNKHSVGAFIGISLTSDIIQAIRGSKKK